MRSSSLSYVKSLWSHNPLPTNCVLYLPLWPSTGLALKSADLFNRTCTVSGSAPVIVPNGWDLPGTDEIIDIGNIGTNIKSLSFWIYLDSTSESILEEVDDTGVTVGAGTMSYGSWDDCFVDGVNTDTITAAWHNVMLTSTTNVDMSAFRFGLVNATYVDALVGEIAAWTIDLGATRALFYFSRTRGRY